MNSKYTSLLEDFRDRSRKQVERLDDDNPKVRTAACRTLDEVGANVGAEKLEELADGDSHKACRSPPTARSSRSGTEVYFDFPSFWNSARASNTREVFADERERRLGGRGSSAGGRTTKRTK